ncbi:hypothetical protein HMPREF0072_0635, partial [Anaerococcus lactolyticus ATCC 51172]
LSADDSSSNVNAPKATSPVPGSPSGSETSARAAMARHSVASVARREVPVCAGGRISASVAPTATIPSPRRSQASGCPGSA